MFLPYIVVLVSLCLSSISQASQGAATYGCDKEYPKIKVSFQKAYSSKDFQKAYKTLEEFIESCDWIKDNRMYWIWSDLSLAAYRLKDAAKCLAAIGSAEDFAKNYGPDKYSDERLKAKMTPPTAAMKALRHNKRLCLDLQKSTQSSDR